VAPPSVNAIDSITGPADLTVDIDKDKLVTFDIATSITPPRGNKTCAGIVVDFDLDTTTGATVDSPAVADASCQVTTTVHGGPTTGTGSLTATITLRRPSGAVVGTITSPVVPVTIKLPSDCPCGDVPGVPALILSLPRNGASNLPPDSVTKNMPVSGAYLKFVYDQSIDISGASVNMGSLSLEATNCGEDTVVWNAPALSYETDYTLSITGLLDCDELLAVADINLSLRTAREVTAANVGQNGEGFLDGSLSVRVVDDMTETVITEAVVRINTSVTHDDPSWVKEDQAYTGGTITFMSTTVALNQPITITVMAPEYEYLTFTGLDAREVVLGLRLRGLGYVNRQETDIIGDFDPAGFNSIHAQNDRSGNGIWNPVRFGMASFGFYRRTLTTLETKDIFGPNVWQTMSLIGQTMGLPLPCNIHLPDMVSAREDIPAGASPAFAQQAFYRLRTDRTGDVYVAVNGASANIQLMVLTELLGGGSLQDLISAIMMTGVMTDIQRVTVPDTGPGSCLSLIVDGSNHGLATDSFTGCPVASDGRRMQLDRHMFGWDHPTNLWHSPTFRFDSAMRVNMTNWAYDPDMSENYSARRDCLDGYGDPCPCRIPVLQLGILGMPDGTQVGISMAVQNLTTGSGLTTIASNLLGLPDVSAIETDLGVSGIEIGAATVQFDWEIRFNALNDRGFTDIGTAGFPNGGCDVGPCFFVENMEWVSWVYGVNPVDPGVGGYNEGPSPASSPANDLIDRIFEAPEAPGSDDGTPPDAYFNTDVLMSRLIDCDHNATQLDPSYTIRDYVGDTPQQIPVDNPVWRFYAPASLDPSATIKAHLPPVPTVAEINALPGSLVGSDFTFESQAETGIPNGFELEWALNAANLPTNTTMQNILIRDQMLFGVRHASQNHQRFIFQNQ
jgi:hypothetical protein